MLSTKHLLTTFHFYTRSIILTFLIVSALSMNAQHFAFLGIPLDGSITNFQNKLSSKGIRIDKFGSKELPAGQRAFTGKFHGYNSKIVVYYNRKTKLVYKVEATIESKKQSVIQNILDKSRRDIEKTYIYKEQHDIEDETNLHYRYIIYKNKQSENYTGILHVVPSYTYFVTNNNIRPSERASFIITFTYEDRINEDLLTPSTTEPKSTKSFFSRKTSEDFFKYLTWAERFQSNDCYDECIVYLMYALDFYKYNFTNGEIPDYEDDIEKDIIRMQECRIGYIISYGYSKPVYKITDNNGNFKCIAYGLPIGLVETIKLNASQISQQINALRKLKNEYQQKINSLSSLTLEEGWSEGINITLPAMFGKDTLVGGFGNIEWRNINLKTKYSYHNNTLYVEVYNDSSPSREVMLFSSIDDIDYYVNILKTADFNHY